VGLVGMVVAAVEVGIEVGVVVVAAVAEQAEQVVVEQVV